MRFLQEPLPGRAAVQRLQDADPDRAPSEVRSRKRQGWPVRQAAGGAAGRRARPPRGDRSSSGIRSAGPTALAALGVTSGLPGNKYASQRPRILPGTIEQCSGIMASLAEPQRKRSHHVDSPFPVNPSRWRSWCNPLRRRTTGLLPGEGAGWKSHLRPIQGGPASLGHIFRSVIERTPNIRAGGAEQSDSRLRYDIPSSNARVPGQGGASRLGPMRFFSHGTVCA